MNQMLARSSARLQWAVFFLSAGLLGFEVSLLRILLVASWHHFAFLIISVVLLGFGASGTALSICRKWVQHRGAGVMFGLLLGSCITMPLCSQLAQHVPIEARFVPSLMWQQISCWIVYWAILSVPFFLGASAIGLALMVAGQNVPRIYAANLLGSAVGAVWAVVAMTIVSPEWLPLLMGSTVLIGLLSWRPASTWLRGCLTAVCLGGTALSLLLEAPYIQIDRFKYLAFVKRLERQNQAQRIAVSYGPRALVEAYGGDVFHDMPFLSTGQTPPPLTVLISDGHLSGAVLKVTKADEAAVVDQTLMAFPYELTPSQPKVLLLNEASGTNIWLAVRHQASTVIAVQPDDNIIQTLRGPLGRRGGGVLDLPQVRTITAEPRHYIDHTPDRFDLIQLVSLESSAAGSGGMGGLGQDHLITVEGFSACLQRLTDDGLLTICRGIQTPPRDNLKLLSTIVAALKNCGISVPRQHIAIVRDYLAVCTMVKATPWSLEQIDRIRQAYRRRELTPVWFEGIQPAELNHPDQLPGPPDAAGDWYCYGAKQLFSQSADRFIDDWHFDIRPPTDDRPFFLDFCKTRSIGEFKRAYGDLWLTRVELAFLFVLAAIVVIGAAGVILTIVPLLFVRDVRQAGGRCVAAVYFTAIGLAYLFLEMTFLSRLTHWIGDPVSAAALTISGFLLFSGLGSLTAQRLDVNSARWIRRVMILLIILGIIEMVLIGRCGKIIGTLPYLMRCVVSILAISPLGFLMGFPMPAALARLNSSAPALVPWAWGVNGFASVMSAPLATALGMSWGFNIAAGAALLLYLTPALLFGKLPVRQPLTYDLT